jgi:hypothetical protein
VAIDFDEPITLLRFTKHGEWFAGIEELGITGDGATEADAMADLYRRVEVFKPALEKMDDWQPEPRAQRWRAKFMVFLSKFGHPAHARFETTSLNELLAARAGQP